MSLSGPDETGAGGPGIKFQGMNASSILFLSIIPLFWLITTLCFSSHVYHVDSVRDVSAIEGLCHNYDSDSFEPSLPLNFSLCTWNFTPTNKGWFFLNRPAHLWFYPFQILRAKIALLAGIKNSYLFEFLQICSIINGFLVLWLLALVVFHMTNDLLAASLASLAAGGLYGFWFWAMQPRGGYMSALFFMLLGVMIYITYGNRTVGLVLSGICCALAVLMSFASIGILAVLLVQEAFRTRTAAHFFSRSLMFCAIVLLLLTGAYATDEILNFSNWKNLCDLSKNVFGDLTGIITENSKDRFPYNLHLFLDQCASVNIINTRMTDPPVAGRISTMLGCLFTALFCLALPVFLRTIRHKGPLFGWVFSFAWLVIFSAEFSLIDRNSFGFLPLVGGIFLFSTAASASKLFKGVWTLSVLLLFYLSATLNIAPLHARPDLLSGPDRAALSLYFAPKDMMLCNFWEDTLEIPYAMRMYAVTFEPSFVPISAGQERLIGEILCKYARSHNIWYLPPDNARVPVGIKNLLGKYFYVHRSVVYPFSSCTSRTYYQLIPYMTAPNKLFLTP